MTSNDEWEWPILPSLQQQRERFPLIREIAYEVTTPVSDGYAPSQQSTRAQSGKALSLNVSTGGMLLLMDEAPDPAQVLRVQVPTPVAHAETPTLAEVLWVRKVPYPQHQALSFVGVRFLL